MISHYEHRILFAPRRENLIIITGIYVLTPQRTEETSNLLARTEQILTGGARLIQYTDPDSPKEARADRANELATLCNRFGASLLIHRDVELAAAVNAAGVHLDEHDTHLSAARDSLGKDAIIGVSCQASMRSAVQAQMHGANYVTFGDLFVSADKPLAKLAPLGLIQSAKDMLDVSIVAIGGITPDNASQVIEAGADAIALDNVYDTSKCKQVTQEFAALFTPKN